MSELKAYKMVNAQYLTDRPCVIPADVYFKSEADKVIAELRDKLRHYPMMAALIDSDNKEIRHQKHKRCLAMASNCRLRARWFGDNAFYKKEQWALRWHKRWLELAEKFKEAK